MRQNLNFFNKARVLPHHVASFVYKILLLQKNKPLKKRLCLIHYTNTDHKLTCPLNRDKPTNQGLIGDRLHHLFRSWSIITY